MYIEYAFMEFKNTTKDCVRDKDENCVKNTDFETRERENGKNCLKFSSLRSTIEINVFHLCA